MKSSDKKLLEEAYNSIYNEGILTRGIASGAGILAAAKNRFKSGSSVLMAQAQQNSLTQSFIKKAKAEILDFYNDLNKMGINKNDNLL